MLFCGLFELTAAISPRVSIITVLRGFEENAPKDSCRARSRRTVVLPLPGEPDISSPLQAGKRPTSPSALPKYSLAIRIFTEVMFLTAVMRPSSITAVAHIPARCPSSREMYPAAASFLKVLTEYRQSFLKHSSRPVCRLSGCRPTARR